MTINTTGPITLSSVNQEVGAAGNAQISLGGANARLLAGIASPGAIRMSDLRGKNLRSAQYFTATTVYTVGTGITFLRFIVVGAGGAAGAALGSGGGGGGQVVTTSSFAVQGGDTVSISVGMGSGGNGGNSSVANSRTGITVTARGGFAGSTAPVTNGGISFSPSNGTQYGGLGAAGPLGGGGAGPAAPGGAAHAPNVGAGAAALFVQINTTQSVYLSPGGDGIGLASWGTTQALYGAGSSELYGAGRSGVVILY